MRKHALLFIALAIPLLTAQQDDGKRIAPFGRRMALVIGNEAYPWKPLTNPVNDARAVAQTLRQAGFGAGDIRLMTDAKQADLRRGVREFVESVKQGDLAFVYYSGHGVEVKGSNYLLPVDLPSDASENYVEDEAVSAQRVMRDLDERGARVRVMILDACRDNPLRASKSIGGGLAPMEGRGSLVVFATEAGHTATDSGVFRRYLLEGLVQPNLSLDDAMKHVARSVARATAEKQVPAIYGILLEDVVLVPKGGGRDPFEDLGLLLPLRPGQVNEKNGQRFVWVPPGKFMMGCSPDDNECYPNEKPAHNVEITKGFWLDQTSVTVGAWKRYRKATGKPALPPGDDLVGRLNEAAGDDNLPAVSMTWDEAKSYCEWGGRRLPTEAEWEHAARAGNTSARYGELDAVAWYGGNSGKNKLDMQAIRSESKKARSMDELLHENGNGAHPVASKQPNAWGLYDMLSHIVEWTADWYDEGKTRTMRGGAWNSPPSFARVSFRNQGSVGARYFVIGVRCVGPN